MSERIYAWVLMLYPRTFREQYGRAALDLFRDRLRGENKFRLWLDVLADLMVSLPREHARSGHPAAVTRPVGGVPVFYTADVFKPNRIALLNGAILSIASFAAVAVFLNQWAHRPVSLIGSHHPGVFGFAHVQSEPADLNTEITIRPTPTQPRVSSYFKIVRVLGALDLNQDNIIDSAEIGTAATSLSTLDIDHDGKLTLEECGLKVPNDATPALAPRYRVMLMRVHPVLAALDTDHDGEISAREIRYATWSLKALDLNQDGKLTEDELLPDRAVVAASLIMLHFDRDGDGRISLKERAGAPPRIRELFDRVGRNVAITQEQLEDAVRMGQQ
jgi:hypothetical protein